VSVSSLKPTRLRGRRDARAFRRGQEGNDERERKRDDDVASTTAVHPAESAGAYNIHRLKIHHRRALLPICKTMAVSRSAVRSNAALTSLFTFLHQALNRLPDNSVSIISIPRG